MSVSVFLLLLGSFVSSLSVLLKLHFFRLGFEVACRKEFFSLQGYGFVRLARAVLFALTCDL